MKVEAIYAAAKATGAPVAVAEARAVPGRGLEGDRYFAGAGTFSHLTGTGRDVTFIAREAIDAVRAEHGIDLEEGRSRRNIVTAGVDLDALIGRTFRIGTAVFQGQRRCEPCRHLEQVLGVPLMAALAGRGGLRADVVTEGAMRAGDEVVLLTGLL